MFPSQTRIGAIGVLASILFAAGADQPDPADPKNVPEPVPPIRVDRLGDPLPPGAVARLGTRRFRHPGQISGLAYSSDGKLLATLCDDQVRIWEIASGKEIRRLRLRADPMNRLAFLPVGKTLLTFERTFQQSSVNTGYWGVLTIWDMASGRRLRTLKDQGDTFAFSPDGKLLATQCRGTTQVTIWDLASGKELGRIEEKEAISSLAFAPDGKTLAIQGRNRVVRLWDIGMNRVRRQFGQEMDPKESICPLAFSPDGRTLAAAGPDKRSITLWEVATGSRRDVVRGGEEYGIGRVAFAPDGKTLALTDPRGIRLWNWRTGQPGPTVRVGLNWPYPFAFSPDGKTIATGDEGPTVRFWDVARGQEKIPFAGHRAWIICLAFSADGKTLASAAGDSTARLWDMNAGRAVRQIGLHGKQPALSCFLSFTPSSRVLVLETPQKGYTGAGARLWDLSASRQLQQLDQPHSRWNLGWVGGGHFSPDGKRAAAICYEQIIGEKSWHNRYFVALWDTASGKELRRLADGDIDVSTELVAFSPDGKFLAIPLSGAVVLYDAATGRRFRDLKSDIGKITALAFSADGKLLAAAGSPGKADDHIATIWDTGAGTELQTLDRFRGSINAVAFCPDSKLLATGGEDKIIRLWEPTTGNNLAEIEGHQGAITALAFAPDGKILTSASADTTILLWDVAELIHKRRALKKTVPPEQLEAWWNALADADAEKALATLRALATVPQQAEALLKERLRPVPADDPRQQRIARLIADLDSNAFPARQNAAAELEKLGDIAQPALEKVLQDKPGAELRQRVEKLLTVLNGKAASPERLRALRAVELLEVIRTRSGRQMLKDLANGAPLAHLSREAQKCLNRLSK